MNISIFASIWCQNLWDELILKNEIKLFENWILEERESKKQINYFFRVFTYDLKDIFFTKKNIKYLEYFPIWVKNKKNLLKNIVNLKNFINTIIWSDLIVIGWWWLIYDNEVQSNKNPLDQWIFRIKMFKSFRKKIVFYGIWINIKNKENYWKLIQIFSWAHKIYVRDSYSHKILFNLWIKSEIIDDPVFYDNIESNKSYLIKEIESNSFTLRDLDNVNLVNKKIWITFRAWYIWKSGNEKIEIFLIRELVEYLLSKRCTVYFLSHSTHKTDEKSNDLEFYRKIVSESSFEYDVFITETIEETYSFYREKKIDLCLSMRLHSMILSQVYEIPFVAFSYSKKTEELVKKIRAKSPMKTIV